MARQKHSSTPSGCLTIGSTMTSISVDPQNGEVTLYLYLTPSHVSAIRRLTGESLSRLKDVRATMINERLTLTLKTRLRKSSLGSRRRSSKPTSSPSDMDNTNLRSLDLTRSSRRE